jgi:type IV secretion system protein TrbL
MGLRAGAGALAGAGRGVSAIASGKAFSAAAGGSASGGSGGPPEWARRLRRGQTISHGIQAAAHAVRSGDRGGGSASVNLKEDR